MTKMELMFKIRKCHGAGDYLIDENNIPALNSIFYEISANTEDNFTRYINPDGTCAYDEREEYMKKMTARYERIKELGETRIYDALMRGDLTVSH